MACCALLNGLSFSRFLPFRGCFGQALFSPFFASGFQNGAQFSIIDSKNGAKERHVFPSSSFLPFLFIEGFDSSALCRSRRELSNEYLLAKIGVDTAENEPLEVWGNRRIRTPKDVVVML